MDLYSAIPSRNDPEFYERTDFTGSLFTELASDEKIDIRMQYPVLKMKNAEPDCFVRSEVAERIKAASELLPEGFKLRIWDAWRPFALQKELYEVYSEDLIVYFGLDRMSPRERDAVIRKYVSDPVENTKYPPVHTTGGAVDVTILMPDGSEAEMGTGFDSFEDRTSTEYYEIHCSTRSDALIRDNRRLLYNIMTEAGFTNLPSEWWHYDYGDRFWAYYNDCPAIYEGIFDREVLNGYGEK